MQFSSSLSCADLLPCGLHSFSPQETPNPSENERGADLLICEEIATFSLLCVELYCDVDGNGKDELN